MDDKLHNKIYTIKFKSYLSIEELRGELICMAKRERYSYTVWRCYITILDYDYLSSFDLWTVAPSKITIKPQVLRVQDSLLKLIEKVKNIPYKKK